MGKRWGGAGGGRRPVLDLGAASLTAASVTAPVEEEVQPPPLAVVAASAPPAAAAALLGLDVYDDDDDEEEEVSAPPPPQDPASTWQRILDPGTNAHYYWNVQTNEVRWTWPDDSATVVDAPSAEDAQVAATQPAPTETEPLLRADAALEADAPAPAAAAPTVPAAAAPAAPAAAAPASDELAPVASVAMWRSKRAALKRAKADAAVAAAVATLAVATTEEEVADAHDALAKAQEAAEAASAAEASAAAEATAAVGAADGSVGTQLTNADVARLSPPMDGAAGGGSALGGELAAAEGVCACGVEAASAASAARDGYAMRVAKREDKAASAAAATSAAAAADFPAAAAATSAAATSAAADLPAADSAAAASTDEWHTSIREALAELESRLAELARLDARGELLAHAADVPAVAPADTPASSTLPVQSIGTESAHARAVGTRGDVLRRMHQLQARAEDWAAGALDGLYLWRQLEALLPTMQECEQRALPYLPWARHVPPTLSSLVRATWQVRAAGPSCWVDARVA